MNSFAGRPVDEWTMELNTENARAKARARGVDATAEQLAELLTDLGFIPVRDELVQCYREIGFRDELALYGAIQPSLPGIRTEKRENSIRTIAERTGYNPKTIFRRRARLSTMIAAQTEIWGQK